MRTILLTLLLTLICQAQDTTLVLVHRNKFNNSKDGGWRKGELVEVRLGGKGIARTGNLEQDRFYYFYVTGAHPDSFGVWLQNDTPGVGNSRKAYRVKNGYLNTITTPDTQVTLAAFTNEVVPKDQGYVEPFELPKSKWAGFTKPLERLWRWVNPLPPTAQVESTVTVRSSGGDYATLNAAEAGENRDLVDTLLVIDCAGFTDNTSVTFAGWGGNDTLRVQGDATTGIWDDTKYILSTEGASGSCILNQTYLITFQNLQFTHVMSAVFGVAGVNASSNANTIIKNCLSKATGAASYEYGHISTASGYFKISNSIGYNYDGSVEGNFIDVNEVAADLYINNNTVYNAKTFIRNRNSNTCELNNNIFDSNSLSGADGWVGTLTGNNNCSDLTDAQMPGANSIVASATFSDVANDIFSLASGSRCINEGLSLLSDANLAVTDDIAGTTRPQGSAFDMGAFEAATTDNWFKKYSKWNRWKK